MAEQKQFKTEVQKLLDLVIHSLYSNKDIFLRELISNASDAIDKARYLSLTDQSILENDSDWKIKIGIDKDAKTLTVSDNGTGMSETELEENLGTIASSGTKKFLEELGKDKAKLAPELIGQFGVGFYAAFMVASEVTVVTRKAGQPAFRWNSTGNGTYTIEPAEREKRGTDVILKLSPENEEYLDEWKIRKTVERFSNYVEHPVTMDVTREEQPRDKDGNVDKDAKPVTKVVEETLNSRKAIWEKSKADVTEEEYAEFYKRVSKDFSAPLATLHWNVEGQTEFRALIFIPEKPIFDMFMPETREKGVQLYVHRVFITDKCDELIPQWLRFLRGVVDSADLPLNVSREILQENRTIRLIRKNIVKKVLETLAEMKEKENDKYLKFWASFGAVLKEGIHLEYENREKIEELALYSSTAAAGKKTSLSEYVCRMPSGQKEIYYLTAENDEAAAASPQLEAFKAKGYEVLFCTDPIDDWVMQDMTEYREKHFRCITKGDVDLDSEEEKKASEASFKKAEAENKELLAALKKALEAKVQDVRLSRRLTESACCLVGDEYSMGPQLEKMMKAMHQEMPVQKKILEINPSHALTAALRSLQAKEPDRLAEYAEVLYDEALLLAQQPIENPIAFAKMTTELLARSIEGELK